MNDFVTAATYLQFFLFYPNLKSVNVYGIEMAEESLYRKPDALPRNR